jgi:hypothetical protein
MKMRMEEEAERAPVTGMEKRASPEGMGTGTERVMSMQ